MSDSRPRTEFTFDDALAAVDVARTDGIFVGDPATQDETDDVLRRGVDERLAEHRTVLERPLVSALANLLLADLVRNPVSK